MCNSNAVSLSLNKRIYTVVLSGTFILSFCPCDSKFNKQRIFLNGFEWKHNLTQECQTQHGAIFVYDN